MYDVTPLHSHPIYRAPRTRAGTSGSGWSPRARRSRRCFGGPRPLRLRGTGTRKGSSPGLDPIWQDKVDVGQRTQNSEIKLPDLGRSKSAVSTPILPRASALFSIRRLRFMRSVVDHRQRTLSVCLALSTIFRSCLHAFGEQCIFSACIRARCHPRPKASRVSWCSSSPRRFSTFGVSQMLGVPVTCRSDLRSLT